MYSRTRCGLCDRARERIEEAAAAVPVAFEEVLIDGREELEREYGLRVPVVLIDGEERFEVEVDPEQLRAALGA
jgi:hypothetical protein